MNVNYKYLVQKLIFGHLDMFQFPDMALAAKENNFFLGKINVIWTAQEIFY